MLSILSLRPAPITRLAPSSFAIWTASCPMTPVPPRMRTVSPAASCARSPSPRRLPSHMPNRSLLPPPTSWRRSIVPAPTPRQRPAAGLVAACGRRFSATCQTAGSVGQGREVAGVFAQRLRLEQAAHDLAGAGLGQRGDQLDLARLGDRPAVFAHAVLPPAE